MQSKSIIFLRVKSFPDFGHKETLGDLQRMSVFKDVYWLCINAKRRSDLSSPRGPMSPLPYAKVSGMTADIANLQPRHGHFLRPYTCRPWGCSQLNGQRP